MSLTPGTKLGSYEIIVALGAGGMGEVYRARDTRLEREVAIKTLRPAGDDERAVDRFLREARALATVNHPNVCQIYEIGDAAGRPFIAMELLDGESLAARLERGALPIANAVDVVLGVLSALQALHRRGVLHRDVKPSNVFLTPYGVKLLDFGLARHADRSIARTETVLTQPGAIVGTPHYMAPEQLLGGLVDDRTDLFAVGVTLFEMITTRRPFAGDTAMAVLHAILHHQPPTLEGSPAIAALDRIVRRALAKEPSDRFATADEMARELRATAASIDAKDTPRVRAATRLAVLPFHLLTPDAEVEFLAYGLAPGRSFARRHDRAAHRRRASRSRPQPDPRRAGRAGVGGPERRGACAAARHARRRRARSLQAETSRAAQLVAESVTGVKGGWTPDPTDVHQTEVLENLPREFKAQETAPARSGSPVLTCDAVGRIKTPMLIVMGEHTTRRSQLVVEELQNCAAGSERAILAGTNHALLTLVVMPSGGMLKPTQSPPKARHNRASKSAPRRSHSENDGTFTSPFGSSRRRSSNLTYSHGCPGVSQSITTSPALHSTVNIRVSALVETFQSHLDGGLGS